MANGLDILKEMTDDLPPFPPSISELDTSCIEYKMDKGMCIGWAIDKAPGNKGGVTRWMAIPGTEFPGHAHTEAEVIVVFEGDIILHYKDKPDIHLTVGSSARNEPNEWHSASFPEGGKYYTVMVPAAPYYPGGKDEDA